MMYRLQGIILQFAGTVLLTSLLCISSVMVAQSAKLPQPVFIELITSTDKFEVNHATEFKHTDLPKQYHNTFLSYIKDSAAAEMPNLKSLVYYSLFLKDGKIIIGDIYMNDARSYIIFKIEDKRYVNYFTKEGVAQIKTLFKL